MISIDDFKKVEIRAGKIISAEKVDGSEKLLKLMVDFGLKPQSGSPDSEENIKQVISGVAKFLRPEELIGITCAFVTNLEPREIFGLKSEAMIMAVSGGGQAGEGDSFFSLLRLSDDIPPGCLVK